MDKIYNKKIKIVNSYDCGYCYGNNWNSGIQSLRFLHNDEGVLFDDFIENTFFYKVKEKEKFGIIPYKELWTAFVQCPHNIPDYLEIALQSSPKFIFKTRYWKESVQYCKGLFCLSIYHRKWIESQLDIPIVNLLLPSRPPQNLFSLKKFDENSNKKVIQIGAYLRRLLSIYQLPVTKIKKCFLKIDQDWVDEQLEYERNTFKINVDFNSVELMQYLADNEYDELLSENIVFVHLYDSASNNTVVECILRNTPILINPLEAIIEYLGEKYPFYFTSLEEAAWKAENVDLIIETHQYLKRLPIKEKLNWRYFIKSFAESSIYKNL